MINSVHNYIINPVNGYLLEISAEVLMAPTRFLFDQFSAQKIDLFCAYEGTKIEKFCKTGSVEKFAKISLVEKVIRVSKIVLTFIVAIPFTPLALLLHQLALRTHSEVKRAYAELEECKKHPGLISALMGRFAEVRALIDERNVDECEVFFQETPSGASVFNEVVKARDFNLLNLLIQKCPQNYLGMLYEKDANNNTLLGLAIPYGELDIVRLLIDKCPQDKVIDYLECCEYEGGTLVTWAVKSNQIDIITNLIEKYPADQKEQFFKLTNTGNTPLDLAIVRNYQVSLMLMHACPLEQLHLLFGPKTNTNLWPFEFTHDFHTTKLQNELVNNPDRFKELLTTIREDGNTLLHRPGLMQFFVMYLKPLGIDIRKVYNRDGLTPFDMNGYGVNMDWLTKPKFLGNQSELVPVLDYPRRAQSLKNEVVALWNSLVFGNQPGNLSPNLLYLGNNQYRLVDIRTALEQMLDYMIIKRPWLGTPRAGDVAALHSFYSEMLTNFETVLAELKRSNTPALSAGFLIDIAKTNLEGRCAEAYQDEIGQKAQLCNDPDGGATYAQMIEKALSDALRGIIDEVVRKQYNGDVHSLRLVCYACGLFRNPDAIAVRARDFEQRVMEARQHAYNAIDWTKFIQDVAKRLNSEMATEYVKQLAPKIQSPTTLKRGVRFIKSLFIEQPHSLDDRYQDAVLKARDMEKKLQKSAVDELKKLTQTSMNAGNIFQAIQDLRAFILPEVPAKSTLVNEIVKEENQKLITLTRCQELDLMAIYREHKSDYAQIEEKVIEFLKGKQKWTPQVRMKIQSQLGSTLKKRIEAAQAFQEVVVPNTKRKDYLAKTIQVQRKYQAGILKIMKDLAPAVRADEEADDELDLSFDQNSYPLPSQAIENNYRVWMAQPDLVHKNRMILKILVSNEILLKK